MDNVTHLATDKFKESIGNSTQIHKVYFASLMLLIPTTILGNGLIVVVVFVTLKLRQQPLYVFLTSLAVADILVGVISMPIKAKIERDKGCFHFPWIMCWIFQLGEIIFSVTSTLHIFVISIDRYFALKYTYEYKILMCRKIRVSVLLFIWTFSVVWSILGIFQWNRSHDISIRQGDTGCVISNRNYFTTTYVICFLAPFSFITCIYCIIYKGNTRNLNAVSQLDISDFSLLKEKNRKKKEFKRLYSILFVFVAYGICWIPCVLLLLLLQYDTNIQDYVTSDWFIALHFLLTNFLPYFNATINPFLYVTFSKELMSSAKKLLSKLVGLAWMSMCTYTRSRTHTLPQHLRDILYLDGEEDCFEMEALSHASLPRRRFTM